MRKLIMKPKGQGLQTPQAYVAHIKNVTGISLPEATMLPKALHIGGRDDFIGRNALLRKLRASSTVISKDTIHEIVAALPDEYGVILAGKDHLLSSWVAAIGKKNKIAYPKSLSQLETEPQFIEGTEHAFVAFVELGVIYECFKGNKLQCNEEPITKTLVRENKVLKRLPSLLTRRILDVSSRTTANFVYMVVAMDVAAAAASTKNVTLNYSFIGQTSVRGSYITENELPIATEGHKDTLVTPFVDFRSRIEMILAKVSAKDALFTGSGRKYQLIDGPGNTLKQLANGDKVYVYNVSINFTELGACLTATGVSQKGYPPETHSPISVGVTMGNGQLEKGPHAPLVTSNIVQSPCPAVTSPALQARDVEDIVRRMLGKIPGVDASATRNVFGDPLTKTATAKNSAEVKAKGASHSEEILAIYDTWKASMGDFMDASSAERTRAQDILAEVLAVIPVDFTDLDLANSIIENAGEELMDAITDLADDIDMGALEAQLLAEAKAKIEAAVAA